MKIHYGRHLISQESTHVFRAYFNALKDLGTFRTVLGAKNALTAQEQAV